MKLLIMQFSPTSFFSLGRLSMESVCLPNYDIILYMVIGVTKSLFFFCFFVIYGFVKATNVIHC
jgi:hypothetical protein